MNLRNCVTLIGRLGRDPEFFQLENGRALAKFSLATSEVYRNQKGDRVETTQWHNCIAWGKTAEISRDLLRKGKQIVLQGKLNYNSYEDKQGIKRYQTDIVIQEFLLLDRKEE